ncbi:hypothetical protein CGI22_04785 [Vibrio parahaemolyticus]|uniref:hypothetical protein n=1 Tax=Vibrio parahaemolyticus TaxID=670 RepID=UPI00112219B6|nr:hypothetical protein [Vibrio parahaemolyticus]TOK27491.1 hypothetical protein CGI22_04785 [Vibrio parahaemolyticus]
MKIVLRYSLLLAVVYLPSLAFSMGIDSMMKVAENGVTNFSVTSTAEYREFIQVGITELNVENGDITKTPYSRENIDKWSLLVRPAKTVVEPGMSKLFKVEHSPTPLNTSEKDYVYQLSFIPTPYFAEGEPVTHSVKVAMGFAPIVIVPAKEDRPIAYKMEHKQDELMLVNNGSTYLRTVLDACPDNKQTEDRDKCSTVVYALAGRHLPIALSDEMKAASRIKVELSTHNMDYEEMFELKPGQISTNQ